MSLSCVSRLKTPAWILLVFWLTVAPGCAQTSVNRITVDELNTALSGQQAVIIDVRNSSDWDSSDLKIAGAIRLDPRNLDLDNLPLPKDAPLVLY